MSQVTPKSGPLVGVRVVELVGLGPCPFAAMLLSDLGADVIRIDRAGGAGLQLGLAELDILARGRPNAAVDLKHPAGRETVLRLVEHADILVEGFRPGVAERLGVGPDECLARNPKLVYGRMTGWGQTGPLAPRAGHDIDYIAVAGALGAIGPAGGPPRIPMNLVGDFGGGSLYLVAGVLAALTHARSTGEGQVVDAAIVDGVAHLLAMQLGMLGSDQWRPARGTNLLDGGVPFYDVYETSDHEWMAVGGLEPQFWQEFVNLIEPFCPRALPSRDDPANWPQLRATLAATFGRRTRAEWDELFGDTDACVSPVMKLDEVHEHPHLVARETFTVRDGLRQPAPAPRFSATPAALTTPPRRAGADTRTALAAWGIDDVETLLADGAVTQAEQD